MAVKSEHGGSITFGTQGGSYKIQSIAGHSESRESIDTTNLATTTNATYIPADLVTTEPFDVVIQFENTVGLPNITTAETITVTAPLATGESVAATVAASGFLTGRTFPSQVAGSTELRQATISIQWAVTPTFTAGS